MSQMAISLHVNLKLSPTQRKFIRLENVSTDITVADLKKEIISKAELSSQSPLEILYCSRLLSDESTLKQLEGSSSYKMVHAICVEPAVKEEPRKLNSNEQQKLVASFRSAMTNPHFRQSLQEFSTRSSIEDLKAHVPGLSDDPVALSMLHDWDLLLHLADPKCVQVLVERHPALADAATRMAASFQQGLAADSQRRRTHSGWLARSLGADVDEDMESEGAVPAQSANQSNPPASNALTPAQFAAALAFVNQSLNGASTPAARPTTSATTPAPVQPSFHTPVAGNSNSNTSGGSGLTPAMLTQALLQAMGSVASSSSSSARPASSSRTRSGRSDREEAALREQFDRFLPQMRELGITDDSLSLRALQATNGDVQAAVNLVFAGLIDD